MYRPGKEFVPIFRSMARCQEWQEIGDRIRRTRLAVGFDVQKAFALAVGVTQASMNSYEKGRSRPQTAELIKIARLTGVPTDWILFGDRRMLPLHLAEKIRALEEAEESSSKTG